STARLGGLWRLRRRALGLLRRLGRVICRLGGGLTAARRGALFRARRRRALGGLGVESSDPAIVLLDAAQRALPTRIRRAHLTERASVKDGGQDAVARLP